eukprot:Phypoly_transcript_10810.p1 GENE.Phypoly_transcript_10810~~Phypoly_transcript_10810.p1  ORF type:complete len:275 (+),score=26.37 Phypoly_transcript_10810:99-827(+)
MTTTLGAFMMSEIQLLENLKLSTTITPLSLQPSPTPQLTQEPATQSSTQTIESQTTNPQTQAQTTDSQTSTSQSTQDSTSTIQPSQTINSQTTTPQSIQELTTTNTQQPAQTQTTVKNAPKQQEAFPYTCPMCLEEFHGRRELYRVVGCRHLYCQQCVVAYYSQSIRDRKTTVKCPAPACDNQILFCNMKNLLPADDLIAHQRIALKSAQNQNKGSIWYVLTERGNGIIRNIETEFFIIFLT